MIELKRSISENYTNELIETLKTIKLEKSEE
nr:MAG TPA: hypothetical protein [Caudoviricetes sp.]